jgi:CIC family chloride channel protein
VNFDKYIRAFIIWRLKHIKDRPFILILSAFIGFTSGLGAVLIKNSVHFIQSLLTKGFARDYHNLLYFAYPVIGILLSVLIARFIIKQRVGHGIPTVLYSISRQNGLIRKHNMFSSIITSALTVGFGGSVGLEGPTVATGAAIGSNIGRALHLNYKTRVLLIGCAAAGAMSAIFKSPVAAIVFAIEVIMLDLTLSSLVPLLLASISAYVTSYLFLGDGILFHFKLIDAFNYANIPFYIILGVLAGVTSVYFTRMYMYVGRFFEKFKNAYIKVAIGGTLLGVVIFVFPSLYGEGYETINSFLEGNVSGVLETSMFYEYRENIYIVLGFLFLMVFFKVIATASTFGSGGVGGIFAPTLFIGSTIGFFFAYGFNSISSSLGLSPISLSNFTLAGMGGTIAGVLHAPLTAIFLIAEITGGYELFLPLMITAAISYTTIKYFEPHSVYTIQLAKRGELMTHHKDKAVLQMLKLEKVVEKNFIKVKPDNTLGDLTKVIKKSARNIFPVVDEKGIFLGLVPMDNIRDIMFNHEMYDKVLVKELMIQPNSVVTSEDTMDTVMKKFKTTGYWNLPVCENGKYIGFVSRANIFNAYRDLLIEFSED